VGDSLTDALFLMPGKPEAMHEALCGVVAFWASMILRSHVLELADDSATSQHLMPRPSSSVTKPISAGARCSAWMRLLTINQFSAREMVDASHLSNSILFFRQPAKRKFGRFLSKLTCRRFPSAVSMML